MSCKALFADAGDRSAITGASDLTRLEGGAFATGDDASFLDAKDAGYFGAEKRLQYKHLHCLVLSIYNI
jgi:hypothetical protein